MLQNLKLTRPLNVLDIEATGLEVVSDRIITLAIARIHTDGSVIPFVWTFNPGMPIPQEVTDIHGITDEMVKDCPPFKNHAKEVMDVLAGADVAGFNILGFDLQILWQELYRAGFEWDVDQHHKVDAGVIYKRMEERSLEAGVLFYLGRKHEDAHDAMGDVKATIAVLDAQLDRHHMARPLVPVAQYKALEGMTVEQLSEFCQVEKDGSRRLDLAGTIKLNKDGIPVFGTKRNRGVPVEQDFGYAEWILRSDFPAQTKQVIRRVLSEIIELASQERIDKANDKAQDVLF